MEIVWVPEAEQPRIPILALLLTSFVIMGQLRDLSLPGLGLLKDKLRPEPRLPMAHSRCAMRSTCFFHSGLSLILLVYLAGGLTL